MSKGKNNSQNTLGEEGRGGGAYSLFYNIQIIIIIIKLCYFQGKDVDECSKINGEEMLQKTIIYDFPLMNI